MLLAERPDSRPAGLLLETGIRVAELVDLRWEPSWSTFAGPFTDSGIRYLLADVGIREVAQVHAHRFRNDTARRLVEMTDLPTVAAWVGHKRLDTAY